MFWFRYWNLIANLKIEILLSIVTHKSTATRFRWKLINEIKITLMVISESDGKQIGLKERLFGAIGVIRMLLTPFCIIGPPADSE